MAAVAPSKPGNASSELYLYGVISTGSLRKVRAPGIGGSDVVTLECGSLTALVSHVSAAGLRFKRRDLDRHLAVLEEAFAETAILPYAFGTVASSTQAVEALLAGEERARLARALEQLEGHAQLNVRATYDEAEVLAEIVRSDPETRRLRESVRQLGAAGHFEQLRLGERVAAAMDVARRLDGERLAAAIEPLVADVVYDEGGHMVVLKSSLLVHRKKLSKLEQELERIARAEAPRIVLEAVGPLPPTAFAATYAAGGE